MTEEQLLRDLAELLERGYIAIDQEDDLDRVWPTDKGRAYQLHDVDDAADADSDEAQ